MVWEDKSSWLRNGLNGLFVYSILLLVWGFVTFATSIDSDGSALAKVTLSFIHNILIFPVGFLLLMFYNPAGDDALFAYLVLPFYSFIFSGVIMGIIVGWIFGKKNEK